MNQSKSVGAVILVGGLGTRLRPLTLHRPKALLPILNRPFLSYQFQLLRRAGIVNVVLAANPAFKKWKKELRKFCPPQIKLEFCYEKKPLGTGGAIRYGFERLKTFMGPDLREVVVLNGDILVEFDLRRVLMFHRQKQADCTILLRQVPDVSRFGFVNCDAHQRIRSFLEKPKKKGLPGTINAGIYVINRFLIEKIPIEKTLSVEKELFPSWLAKRCPLYGMKSSGYWNDIGTVSSYLRAQKDLFNKKSFWTGNRNLCKGRSLTLGRNVQLKGSVCLGSHVSIANDCVLTDSVVMDRVHIEKGVQMRGTILDSGCRIGKFSLLAEGTVLGKGTQLPPHTRT